MDDIDTKDLIPDPACYWEMAMYAGRVHAVLMMLRHLYEPNKAVEWLSARQHLLDNDVPARLLLTHSGLERVNALIQRINDGAFS